MKPSPEMFWGGLHMRVTEMQEILRSALVKNPDSFGKL